MANNTPEFDLIKLFESLIDADSMFGIAQNINFGSDSETEADVEYLSKNGEYLILEAKSHKTRNAPNTRHQIFGQLLIEQSKCSAIRALHCEKIALGILIPGDYAVGIKDAPKTPGDLYYRKGFKKISYEKFIAFGELVQAKYVFVTFENRVEIYSWSGFYCNEGPIRTVCAVTAQS